MDTIERVKRAVGLAIGCMLLISGSILLLLGVRIPYFFMAYTIEIGGDTRHFEFDFSVFTYFAAIIAGLGSIMVALKLSRLPENVIVSYPWSRFIAASLLAATGVASFLIFGVEFGGFTEIGHWMFLGGLPISFPIGLVPLMVGLPLLVISLFTFMKLKITRTAMHLVLDEMRFPRAMSTEIPLADIQAIRLTSGKTGVRFAWVIVFIVPVVFLYIDGFSFLLNPTTFGAGFLMGYAYIASATIQLVCMLLLVINSHQVLDIVTADKLYELPFFPANYKSLVNSRLAFFLQAPPSPARVSTEETRPSIEQAGDLKRLGCGLLLVVLGILGRAIHLWAGEILMFVLLIAGIIISVDAIKNDLKFVNPWLQVRVLDGGASFLFSSNGWLFRTEHYFSNVRQLEGCMPEEFVNANASVQPRKLTILDHLLVTAIMFFMGFQGFPVLLFVPATMVDFLAIRAFLVTVVCIALAMAIMLNPARVFKVKLGDRNFQVPVKMPTIPSTTAFASLFINFARKYKMAWQTHRIQLLSRVVEMVVAAGIGILASAIAFFA